MAGEQIFVGQSEMAALMRLHDWSRTALGDPKDWPQALKAAVRILLTSRFEMWLGWGPDINFLYNDAYRPTLGQKHPHALGMPTRILWSEIWELVQPRLRMVYEHGEATWDRALLLILQRSGYPEETYHTFSYSPLIGDTGRVEGVFCAVTEDTERIVSERRLAALKTLASELADASTQAQVFAATAVAARQADRDVLFSAAYAFDDQGQPTVVLDELGGITAAATAGRWQLRSVWDGVPLVTVELCEASGFGTGAWEVPAQRVAVVALSRPGKDRPAGALVVGLNPMRPFDDDYRAFLRLVAGQVAAKWASVGALLAERLRAQAMDEALALRQQAAEALRRANDQLASEVEIRTSERDHMRSLFRQAPSFMALLSGPDHVFELANDAYLRLVGHRELVGKSVRDALPEIAGQGYVELLDTVYRSGEPFVGEALPVLLQRVPGAAREQRYVHLVYQPLIVEGKTRGIFVDGYDVTEQKQADEALRQLNNTLEARVEERTAALENALEQLRLEGAERSRAERALQQAQKMEALGALTGGVAHDFNNLLQVISGNLQLLARMTADIPLAKKRIDSALNGVARGARLSSQLLSFGRRQPLEPKVVNVGRFIRTTEELLRRALGEGVEIETVISGGLWNTAVDPGRFEDALLNLAINARDAMQGHGRLTIEAGNASLDDDYCRVHDYVQPGQYVMVAVTDTGEGMPPDVMNRAFEPFFSTKPEGKGTGLGLSMVYGFVKQSGGHVVIYSEVGEGTTFRIYLPRSLQAEDPLIAPASNGPVEGGTEVVLVVEDDEAVRETTVSTLRELGYHVLKARDADSALTVIDSGLHIDVLFTDVVMPGKLRSPELAQKALQRLPGLAVLFTSGYTENSIVHGGRLDAGVELLSKPYTREALARRLRQLLSQRTHRLPGAGTAPAATVEMAQGKCSWEVILVESDDALRAATAKALEEQGHSVRDFGTGGDALTSSQAQRCDVLIIDTGLADMAGTACAADARQRQPDLAIVFAIDATVDVTALATWRAGIVAKPYSIEQLVQACILALATSGPPRSDEAGSTDIDQ